MAKVVLTLKIMPETPSVDLVMVEKTALTKIEDFAGKTEHRTEIEPIAFGLKAVKITFVMDEAKGGTEALEEIITKIDGVQSVEVTDVRRAIG